MHGPDWDDSDDSLFEDDMNYEEYKATFKKIRAEQYEPPILTEEDLRIQKLDKLYVAISNGDIKSCSELIDNNFDVNSVLKDGYTPMLLACCHGNYDMVKFLIEKGGNVNDARDFTTALMMACSCPDYTSPFDESLKVVKLLVEKGANVKSINRKRMDALMFACSTGNFEVVKYLVPLCDKKAVDNQRWNALYWAVSLNKSDIALYLYENDFDVSVIDVRGNNFIDIVRSSDCSEILNLILEKSKDSNETVYNIPDLDFEKHFENLKKGDKPYFLLDIYNILNSVRCGHLFSFFLENNVTLEQFLSMNNDDLIKIGIVLPFQRKRIISGIHRFHKHPYHPRSLCVVPLNSVYSNIDVATQLLSATKQLIAMESSLKFIEKHSNTKMFENEQIASNIFNIRKKVLSCKKILHKLKSKTEKWDKIVMPVDCITKNSIKSKIPWKGILFSVSIISFVAFLRLNKK